MLTVYGYGYNSVNYMRIAKGEINSAGQMKAAPDVRTYGADFFNYTGMVDIGITDAPNGETTTYTLMICYVGGYTEFQTFEVTPTEPVVAVSAGTITLSNVDTNLASIDWVRCAPGELSSLYEVRHTKGSQVRTYSDITDEGTIVFDNLPAGTYTLCYLYDEYDLSYGMMTVTVE